MPKLCLKIVLELAQKGMRGKSGKQSHQLSIIFPFPFESIKHGGNTQGKNEKDVKTSEK